MGIDRYETGDGKKVTVVFKARGEFVQYVQVICLCKGRRFSSIIEAGSWGVLNTNEARERAKTGIKAILEGNEVRAALKLIQDGLH